MPQPTSPHSQDPAFSVPVWRGLTPAGEMASEANGDYLAHWLARHPRDLFRHAQRVSLHGARGDGDQAYAALLDLFIALGEKGRPLRERLLKQVWRLLSPEKRAVLERGLESGISRVHRLGDVPGSVLGRPIQGRLDMVRRQDAVDAGRSYLEEARALIADSLIDEARSVLEQALLEDPEDAEVAEELVLLYRATRDDEGYAAMWRQLRQRGRLPAAWAAVSQESDHAG